MSVTASLPSANSSASQTTHSTLGSMTIEEVMSDLYLTAYGPGSNERPVNEASNVFSNLASLPTFLSSAQRSQHRFLDQRLTEGPKVVYVPQQMYNPRNPMEAIPGKKIFRPMVPILKADYFDMEAFDKQRQKRSVSDDISDILWSKCYTVELPFNSSPEDQVMTNEELDMSNRYLHFPPEVSPGENRWRDVVENSAALPGVVFRTPYDENAIEESKGIDAWFPSPTGEALYPARILLSDKYMLVPLPSETTSHGLSWETSGSYVSDQYSEFTCVNPLEVNNMLVDDFQPPIMDSRCTQKRHEGPTVMSKKVAVTKSADRKQSTTRKRTVAARSRLIDPTTRARAESGGTPLEPASAYTPASAPPSTPHAQVLTCWLSHCSDTFTSVNELAAHYRSEHFGHLGLFRCPYSGCMQMANKLADIKRHMKTKRHVGNSSSIMCSLGCKKWYSRADALRRHHIAGCNGKNAEADEDE